jgi:hypothetical protein
VAWARAGVAGRGQRAADAELGRANSYARLQLVTSPPPAVLRPLPALFVRAVYWSTPIFVALDFIYGVSLRIPFLDALPGTKAVYYVADLACAVAITARPRWTAAVGFAESTLNIALLVLSTGAAYLAVLDSAVSPDVVIVNPFTPQAVASLAISALVLAASYVLRTTADYGLRTAD